MRDENEDIAVRDAAIWGIFTEAGFPIDRKLMDKIGFCNDDEEFESLIPWKAVDEVLAAL